MGDFEKWGTKRRLEHLETRQQGAELKFLLPRATVCFSGRLVAMVSLVADLYPVSGIGKFGVVDFGKRDPKGVKKHLQMRKSRRKLKFLASVGFRLLPRPRGRGGFVSFGIISAI